jgi:hypothetical protein
MTLTGPLSVLMAFVASAVLSRPKMKTKDAIIAELEGQVDALKAELDLLRPAQDALLGMLVEEQRERLQLERDLIHAQEDYATMRRENAMLRERALAPQPPLVPVTSAEAQRLGAQALERLMQFRVGPLMSQLEPGVRLPQSLDGAMQQMDAFICNCAPGRHQLFGAPERDELFGGPIEGDDTL